MSDVARIPSRTPSQAQLDALVADIHDDTVPYDDRKDRFESRVQAWMRQGDPVAQGQRLIHQIGQLRAPEDDFNRRVLREQAVGWYVWHEFPRDVTEAAQRWVDSRFSPAQVGECFRTLVEYVRSSADRITLRGVLEEGANLTLLQEQLMLGYVEAAQASGLKDHEVCRLEDVLQAAPKMVDEIIDRTETHRPKQLTSEPTPSDLRVDILEAFVNALKERSSAMREGDLPLASVLRGASQEKAVRFYRYLVHHYGYDKMQELTQMLTSEAGQKFMQRRERVEEVGEAMIKELMQQGAASAGLTPNS